MGFQSLGSAATVSMSVEGISEVVLEGRFWGLRCAGYETAGAGSWETGGGGGDGRG